MVFGGLGRYHIRHLRSHWLGTDQYGRDVLSRLVWGGRVPLAVGTVAVVIGSAGGVTVGLVAGYAGGTVDLVASRVIDAFLTVPAILLALALIGQERDWSMS